MFYQMILLKKIINRVINLKSFNFFFKKLRGNFVILYYHGVADNYEIEKIKGPNKHLFVSKSNFSKQMEFLKNNKIDVISIDELYKLDFNPPKFSVVLSFDDGYKDNIKIAYPILKEKNFPFIIYLIPKILNEEPWVWWIELWDQLQKKNMIIIDKDKIDVSTEDLKISLFLRIKKKMKLLQIKAQKKMIKELFDLSSTTNMSEFFLNEKEIKLLIEDKLVTIGSHSQDHLSLKKFSKNIIYDQINKSKIYLEKYFDISIKHFSYPYGQNEDIAFYEHEILSALGFVTSVTTMDYSYKKFNPHYLNRCSIGPNVSENDFKRKLLGVDRILRKIFFR